MQVYKNSRITRKNRLWIQEYIKTKNGSEAVRRVYPDNKNPDRYASVLMRKNVIKEELERYFKALDISNEDIIKSLTEIAINGKVEANRIRCYELLAKIKGLLKDTQNTQVTAIFSNIEDRLNKDLHKEPIDVTTSQTGI